MFLMELERQEIVPQSIDMLGKEIARKLKETEQTLASIAALYVKTYYELDDLKKSLPSKEVDRA
jgi:hypothetical protein